MKRYESYKDSGVKWLGEIPGHWEVIRLKALLIERIEKNNNKENLIILSLLKDKGIIPYDEKGAIGNNSKEDLSQYKIARKGDLVINSMNVIIGSVGITQYDGYISPAYYSFKPRGIINLIYYYYLMTLRSVQQSIRCYSKGIMEIRLRITSNDFLSMPFPFPPKSEQTAIANYLNSVTSKIDEAISQQQKMIDLLNERKQIIIQNAVTKGLDPNAKMKDSGVEWIGEIPEHWKVFKTLFSLSMPITDGPHETPELYDSGIPFISAEAITNGKIDFSHKRGYISDSFYKECCKKYIPKRNDIYMIKSGATTGRTAIVDTDEVFTIWSPLAVFRPNTNVIKPFFLLNVLRSTYYLKQVELNWSYGTQQNIGMRILEKLLICVPPLSEQEIIIAHINKSIIPINKAIDCANKMISLLQERKQIIINDVVTGKVKVV